MPLSLRSRAFFLRARSHWRSLDRVTRGVLLLALVALGVGGLWFASRYREWPVQVHLQGHGTIYPLAFTPDGQSFATASTRGVTLWDLKTGQERTTWTPAVDLGQRFVAMGSFYPDGQTFAAISFAHPKPARWELIDVASGQNRATIPTRWNTVYHVGFVDQGQTLRAVLGNAEAGGVQEVATWDVATGQPLANRPLTCLSQGLGNTVSADGRWLGLRSQDARTVLVWDLDADRETIRLAVPSSLTTRLSYGLCFAPEAQSLVAGLEDGSFLAWDVATGRVVATFPGHQGGYQSWELKITPDGKTLVSRGELTPSSVLGGFRTLAVQAFSGGKGRPHPELIAVEFGTGRLRARASSASIPLLSRDGTKVANTEDGGTGVAIRAVPDR